jgi:hypothetical protein
MRKLQAPQTKGPSFAQIPSRPPKRAIPGLGFCRHPCHPPYRPNPLSYKLLLRLSAPLVTRHPTSTQCCTCLPTYCLSFCCIQALPSGFVCYLLAWSLLLIASRPPCRSRHGNLRPFHVHCILYPAAALLCCVPAVFVTLYLCPSFALYLCPLFASYICPLFALSPSPCSVHVQKLTGKSATANVRATPVTR